MTLTELIHEYEQQQRSRALGGLRALSGFDFQLRCHLAEFVEHLVSSNGILVGGLEFAHGLEALSDFTTTIRDVLVCVQAKRTLTTTAMAQAAVEFATIAEFLENSLKSGAASIRPRFRVVGNRSELTDDWNWDTVTLPPKDASKRPELQRVWQALITEQRLDPPQVERDPWWRIIAATFQRLDKPFEFARQALDLCLRRHESSAERVRDDIAELFRQHLSPTPLKNFQAAIESDFAPDPDDRLQPLRVGYRPSLALVRNRQFLTRDVQVRNAIKKLDELLLNQEYGNVTGLPVLWISGPSGSGKSVLLLQVLESLVKSGLSAVWLEDDAQRVVPLLHAFCAERDANSTDLPEFIFIDDLYSPQNQQRIELPELDNIVGTQPFYRWPIVVTCGPPEFHDRLERESSRSTLHLERWSLPLVEIQPSAAGDPAEADLFTAWFQQRTGKQPRRGSAFSERLGLMISMAFELRFEDPNAIKDFAGRFRERLKADELDQKLVVPLALNRLYLPAPAEWLTEQDRERFDAINQEKDFSILDLGGDGEFLRLTHPHISNAIYRAIRDPASPRAFANDLAEAMRRAMASNLTVLRLLLRALSSADPRITERLEDVDLDRLAETVTADWKKSDVGSRLRGSELADVSTSWACWHARKPELRLEQRLGHSPFSAARASLRDAGPAWSVLWQQLRAAFPGETSLLTDAAEWLDESALERSRGWSFVWEEVWNQRGLLGSPFAERTLVLSARGWLQRQWDQDDWHFVWTKLVDQPAEAANSQTSELSADVGSLVEIIELGWQWLTHKPSSMRSGVVPHDNLAAWAYVWQDLLPQKRFESDPARSELLNVGVVWLEGREDLSEWTYVLRDLLESPSLP
ncbi:MAG: ATP-binding protein, partial [Planctomycetota bacterium]|nr:ATP-binding protein [Planctomycetota bacterium]